MVRTDRFLADEPTSMLQRMAEDMEFSECCEFNQYCGVSIVDKLFPVDAAAAEPDQYKRIAFVAGFAMSNYSSTIGRIAKPFNPMLVRMAGTILRWDSHLLIREKPLNTFTSANDTGTFRSKSATTLQFRPVGRILQSGTTTAKLMRKISLWASHLRSDRLAWRMPT